MAEDKYIPIKNMYSPQENAVEKSESTFQYTLRKRMLRTQYRR